MIENTFQIIWASIIAMGLVKVIIVVVVIGILSKIQPVLGFLASLLFIAYLLHWIG